jgi:hypothetical protein
VLLAVSLDERESTVRCGTEYVDFQRIFWRINGKDVSECKR